MKKTAFLLFLFGASFSASFAQGSTSPMVSGGVPQFKTTTFKAASAADKEAFDENLAAVRNPSAQKPEDMLRLLTADATYRPLVWCAAENEKTKTQVCTFRVEGIADDAVAGELKRILFKRMNAVWQTEKIETSWRCQEGRGKSDVYHTTLCK